MQCSLYDVIFSPWIDPLYGHRVRRCEYSNYGVVFSIWYRPLTWLYLCNCSSVPLMTSCSLPHADHQPGGTNVPSMTLYPPPHADHRPGERVHILQIPSMTSCSVPHADHQPGERVPILKIPSMTSCSPLPHADH